MQNYSLISKIYHWSSAILIIGLLSVGLYMTSLPSTDPSRMKFVGLHKNFGVIVLILLTMRIIHKFIHKDPSLPVKFSKIEKSLAHYGHYLLYILSFTMAISGFLMSMAGKYGIRFFGYDLPRFIPINNDMASTAHYIHVLLPYFFIAVITIHLIAIPFHYIHHKTNILKRMT